MKLRRRYRQSPARVLSGFRVAWLIWWCCSLLCPAARAQQTAPPPDPAAQTSQEKKQDSGRMFGVIPAYHVTDSEQVAPMTSKEKFQLALKQTIDPMTFVGAGIDATIYQTLDHNPGYGQGASRFAKSFGASLADAAIGNMLGTAVFPTLFHEDPRYFRKGDGGVKGRIGYALSRVVVTRTDAGERAFNWSMALSSVGTSAISNFYAPIEDRGAGLIFRKTGWSFVSSAGFNVLTEFWPDIECKLFRHCPTTPKTNSTMTAPKTK